jgi:hypothetical protein
MAGYCDGGRLAIAARPRIELEEQRARHPALLGES